LEFVEIISRLELQNFSGSKRIVSNVIASSVDIALKTILVKALQLVIKSKIATFSHEQVFVVQLLILVVAAVFPYAN